MFAVLILSSYIYIPTHSVLQLKPHFLYFHYSAQPGLWIGPRLLESCSFCFRGRFTKAELFLLPAYRLWVTWRGWLRAAATAAAVVSFSSLPPTIPLPPLRPSPALASSSSLPSQWLLLDVLPAAHKFYFFMLFVWFYFFFLPLPVLLFCFLVTVFCLFFVGFLLSWLDFG